MNQFVESVKRLYDSGAIDKAKVLDLRKNGKLSETEKEYILNAH